MLIPKIDRTDAAPSQTSYSKRDDKRQAKLRARDRSYGLTDDSDLASLNRLKSAQTPAQLRAAYRKESLGEQGENERRFNQAQSDRHANASFEALETESASRRAMSVLRSHASSQQRMSKADPGDVNLFEAVLSGGLGQDKGGDVDQFANASPVTEPMGSMSMPAWSSLPATSPYSLHPEPTFGARSARSVSVAQPAQASIPDESVCAQGREAESDIDVGLQRSNARTTLDAVPSSPSLESFAKPGAFDSAEMPQADSELRMESPLSAPYLMQEGSQFELLVQTRDLGPLHLKATQRDGGWQVHLHSDNIDSQSLLVKVSQSISRGLSRDLGVPVHVEVTG